MELTAEKILGADDLPLEKCDCPEWGGHFYIKTLNSLERQALDAELWADGVTEAQRPAIMVSHCACTSAGGLIFTREQAEALEKKNGNVVARAARMVQRQNYISDERAKQIEKNSKAQPSDSGTA